MSGHFVFESSTYIAVPYTHRPSVCLSNRLQGILHSALHNEYWRLIDPQGKPPGVMGWWPSRAVTFLENHDTGSTQVRYLPDELSNPNLLFSRESGRQANSVLATQVRMLEIGKVFLQKK